VVVEGRRALVDEEMTEDEMTEDEVVECKIDVLLRDAEPEVRAPRMPDGDAAPCLPRGEGRRYRA
jgi:hypothetical protein